MPKPFLKWAGGKAWLAERIASLLPERMDTYCEPFLGGGAVLLHLAERGAFTRAVVGDVNPELITAWKAVRDDVESVIGVLQRTEFLHRDNPRLMFDAEKRAKYTTPAFIAARMIYLNHTCFNGLYRVNKRGEFNVPFGRHKNPTICDAENLRAVSRLLNERNVEFVCGGFRNAIASAPQLGRRGGVFIDPPYVPASSTSSFTSYSREGFPEDDQRLVSSLMEWLSLCGAPCVASNSDTPLVRELYGGFNMGTVYRRGTMSSKGTGRKPVPELLIWNKYCRVTIND